MVWNNIFGVVRLAVLGGIVVLVLAFLYLTADVLAGKTTTVDGKLDAKLGAGLELAVDKHTGEILAYTVAALFGSSYTLDRWRRSKAAKLKGQASTQRRRKEGGVNAA